MDNYTMQVALELGYNRDNKASILEQYKEDLLKPCRAYITEWLSQDFDWSIKGTIEVVTGVGKMDVDETCWRILTTALLDKEAPTLQQLLGMFFNQLDEYTDIATRKGRILSPFVEAVLKTNHVKLERDKKYIHMKPVEAVADMGQKRYGYVLPSIVAPRVMSNNDGGWLTDKMHVITGGKLKQHDGELCLDHINRLNHVCYMVETRLGYLVPPECDQSHKWLDKKGRFEDDDERLTRIKRFEDYKSELQPKIDIMVKHGNRFFIPCRYDTRLRTYLKAHHFDFIGQKHSRAIVQPVKGAKVEGMEEYV